MSRERHPRTVLREHGVHARRGMGQNFLVSERALDRVIETAGLLADQVVLEIGTSAGWVQTANQ